MSMRDAVGWGALGLGGGVALMLAAGMVGKPATEKLGIAAEKPALPPKPGELRLDKAMQARIGLRVAVLAGATSSDQIHGFARGLDAGPLAAIEAEIATARGAASASSAELARLTTLAAADQSASRQSVEAARATATADAARVHLAEQRVALEYGPGIARLGEGGRRALLAAIARGDAALVRVDLPGGDARGVRLAQGGAAIQLLGAAAVADPKLQSPGLLGLVRGPAARLVNTGRAVDVVADGSAIVTGVLVPSDAVVRWRGGLWLYRQTSATSVVHVELVDARPVEGGWFATSGIAPGDRVVVSGAGAVLALDRAGDVAGDSDE